MSRQPARRTAPLTVEAIVDAARALISESGFDALSMRRLGSVLGVDPMAVYHHIANKRELLWLVTERVVGEMVLADEAGPWDERVRAWARAYWDVVAANRDLVLAGLGDDAAAGTTPLVAPLTQAVADSGIDPRLVEANVWLVVDFVHGSSLGAASPRPPSDRSLFVQAFDAGIDTIVAGIEARSAVP